MAGRHRAARRTWSQRAAALPVPQRAPGARPRAGLRPVLAAGMSGILMAGLCAATLAGGTQRPPAPVIAVLDSPPPLRGSADRASRDAIRSDLTQESEAVAAQARQHAEQQQQRVRAEAKTAGSASAVPPPAPPPPPPPVGGSPSANRDLGRVMTLEYGWDEGQFGCLDQIWSQESNWTTTAQNPSSGAYGIPQALPGTKMATVAPDWQTNPATQIAWGLGYIADRYGTPCSAWSFKQSAGWY